MWSYSIPRDELTQLAQHDPARFDPANPSGTFMTNDEESSGIIPLDRILGPGWYLLDSQVHKSSGDPERVEPGQLLALYYPPGNR